MCVCLCVLCNSGAGVAPAQVWFLWSRRVCAAEGGCAGRLPGSEFPLCARPDGQSLVRGLARLPGWPSSCARARRAAVFPCRAQRFHSVEPRRRSCVTMLKRGRGKVETVVRLASARAQLMMDSTCLRLAEFCADPGLFRGLVNRSHSMVQREVKPLLVLFRLLTCELLYIVRMPHRETVEEDGHQRTCPLGLRALLMKGRSKRESQSSLKLSMSLPCWVAGVVLHRRASSGDFLGLYPSDNLTGTSNGST